MRWGGRASPVGPLPEMLFNPGQQEKVLWKNHSRAGRDVPLPKAGSQIPLERLTQGDSTDVPSHRLKLVSDLSLSLTRLSLP